MASAAQIEANRRNAQKSVGPRTERGKAAVGQNALRHGLCSGFPLMSDESSDAGRQLLAALVEENQPVGVNEEILVYKMAEHFFFQKRAGFLLAQEFDEGDFGVKNSSEVGLMLRYHTSADRGFTRALNELRRLQKERSLQEIGFDSQKVDSADTPETRKEPDTAVPGNDARCPLMNPPAA